jgi:hypothetical protein
MSPDDGRVQFIVQRPCIREVHRAHDARDVIFAMHAIESNGQSTQCFYGLECQRRAHVAHCRQSRNK